MRVPAGFFRGRTPIQIRRSSTRHGSSEGREGPRHLRARTLEGRHGLPRGADRVAVAADLGADRPPEGPRDGPPLTSRPADNGRPTQAAPDLPPEEGHREVPEPDLQTRTQTLGRAAT